MGQYQIVVFDKTEHQRSEFFSGVEDLDRYLKTQASIDQKALIAVPYILIGRQTGTRIIGYYTLSSSTLKLANLPETLSKKIPRYPVVPATLLGRLAIDQEFKGKGLGEFLLIDALFRAQKTAGLIASFAVVVDPKNNDSTAFYKKYDFEELTASRLFLTMKKIELLRI